MKCEAQQVKMDETSQEKFEYLHQGSSPRGPRPLEVPQQGPPISVIITDNFQQNHGDCEAADNRETTNSSH